jgi:DNA-binding MarR family transcriptional regulator
MEHLLGQICRLHHQNAHSIWDEIGLHRGQPRLLHALWGQEGLSHSDLAKQAHVRPATITKMVQRMERAGFVTCRADAKDQRISRIYLTDAGRAVQKDVEEAWRRSEQETFAEFTAEERLLLRRFLTQIRDNLEKVTADKPNQRRHR